MPTTDVKQTAGLHILQARRMEQSASSQCYIACHWTGSNGTEEVIFSDYVNIIGCHCGVSVLSSSNSQDPAFKVLVLKLRLRCR